MEKFWSYAGTDFDHSSDPMDHLHEGLWRTADAAKEAGLAMVKEVFGNEVVIQWNLSPSHFKPGQDLWMGYVFEDHTKWVQSQILIVYELEVLG